MDKITGLPKVIMEHTVPADASPESIVPINNRGGIHNESHNNNSMSNTNNEVSFELWNQGFLRDRNSNIANNSSSHALNDRQVQGTFSPFFPNVDVPPHLPITNPPIFQSGIARYDEPVRRRRISIGNGQIGQLGEDLETMESLYGTQVPHMPPMTQAGPSVQHPILPALSRPTTQYPIASNHEVSSSPVPSTSSSVHLERNQSPPPPAFSNDGSGSEPAIGASGWKRERMLERNRVAAYRCRQRKKVAQLQLQKDFDVLAEENRVMKKKLDYYEKLVIKFKAFFEAHLSRCSSNESESLQIIESMLRIDSGVSEVDDSGLVVKMES